MEDLFKKFLDNHCSFEEVKKLLAFFSNPENEVLLRKLINENITNSNNSNGQELYPSENILNEMKKQLDTEDINLISFFNKTKLQAALLFVLLFGEKVSSIV